jgi:PilZ domain-containing protein
MDPVQTDRRQAPRSDQPRPSGRRAELRAPVRLLVSVETLDGTRRVSLLEVSLSGARLEGETLPPVGKDVVLTCGSVEAFGTIVWAAGERCGVHFDDPIGIPELVALRRVAVAAKDAGMTAEEYEAAADWQTGLAR